MKMLNYSERVSVRLTVHAREHLVERAKWEGKSLSRYLEDLLLRDARSCGAIRRPPIAPAVERWLQPEPGAVGDD